MTLNFGPTVKNRQTLMTTHSCISTPLWENWCQSSCRRRLSPRHLETMKIAGFHDHLDRQTGYFQSRVTLFSKGDVRRRWTFFVCG